MDQTQSSVTRGGSGREIPWERQQQHKGGQLLRSGADLAEVSADSVWAGASSVRGI